MVLTRRQARTSVFESIINNDILETIAGFVDCKDLVNLSLTSKQLSSSVTEVAVRMINFYSSDVRYGGDDEEDLPALQELNYLRALSAAVEASVAAAASSRQQQVRVPAVAAASGAAVLNEEVPPLPKMPTMPDEWF